MSDLGFLDLVKSAKREFDRRDIEGLRALAPQLERAAALSTANVPGHFQLTLPLTVLVDLDFVAAATLQNFMLQFQMRGPGELFVSQAMYVALGCGVVHFLGENHEQAICELDYIIGVPPRDAIADLTIQAMFYKARCLRALGRSEAKNTISRARVLATEHGLDERAAAIMVQEAGMCRRLGDEKESKRLIEMADRERSPKDFVCEGNILSHRGQVAAKSGDYADAIEYLQQAVEVWHAHNCLHRYLARDLCELARVEHLHGRRLEARLEDFEQRETTRLLDVALAKVERENQRSVLLSNSELQELTRAVSSKARKGREAQDAENAKSLRSLHQSIQNEGVKLSKATSTAFTRAVAETARQWTKAKEQPSLDTIDELQRQSAEHCTEARDIYQEPLNHRGMVTTLLLEADRECAQGDHAQALQVLSEAVRVASERNDSVAATRVAIGQGCVHLAANDIVSASIVAGAAWKAASETSLHRLKMQAAILCGRCAYRRFDLKDASRWHDVAARLNETERCYDDVWEELTSLGAALTQRLPIETEYKALLQEALAGTATRHGIRQRLEKRFLYDLRELSGSNHKVAELLKMNDSDVSGLLSNKLDPRQRRTKAQTTKVVKATAEVLEA